MILLLGLLSKMSTTVLCEQINSDNNTVNNLDHKQYLSLKGINMVKDGRFKDQFLSFLELDSKLKYEELYYYFSTNYLERLFLLRDINSALEYKNDMEEYSDRTECKYLEILNVQMIAKEKYQVDLTLKTNLEGQMTLIKKRYFFVKEGVEWKYDGLDSDFMEWIPLEEE